MLSTMRRLRVPHHPRLSTPSHPHTLTRSLASPATAPQPQRQPSSPPPSAVSAPPTATISPLRITGTAPPTLPAFTPSLWDRVFNRSSMARVPLTDAYPTLSSLDLSSNPLPPLSETVQMTTLPSGLRIATLPSHSPISSVGVFVDVGSRYETPETSGLTHFLELMSLKSTVNRTDFRLVREMLKMGANVSASSSREHMVYAADCLKEHVPAIIGTLADVIQHHIFHIEELMEEKEIFEGESAEKEKAMDLKVIEAIHEAAYLNNTLGLPMYAPLHNLPSFTSDALKRHQQTYFTPKRMVITGVGVEHQQLVDLVQATFTELGPDVLDASAKAPAEYTGGEVRVHKKGDVGLVHIALAFETASWHSDDLLPMCVLQVMMGGGGSFSAGGPGKGMYSRLYHHILNKYEWVESANSFNSIFSDSGLFGIYATTQPSKAKQLVDALTKELLAMPGPIEAQELKRAKAQLQSVVFMGLESRALKLEDIGRQIMTYGKVQSAQELAAEVDKVTAEDVQRVAAKMLQTPLSVAAFGDLSFCPRYDLIQNKFTDALGGGKGGQAKQVGGGQREQQGRQRLMSQ